MSTLKTALIAGTVGIAAFAASGLPIGAQTGDGTDPDAGTTDTETAVESDAKTDRHKLRHGLRFVCGDPEMPEIVATELAEELGISVDELTEAFTAASDDIGVAVLAEIEEHLAAKVEAGELTQEEADARLERIESCERPDVSDRRGPRGHHRGFGPRDAAPDSDGADADADPPFSFGKPTSA